MKPTPRTEAVFKACEQTAPEIWESFGKMTAHANALERQLSDALDALARVRAEEREACAKVCEGVVLEHAGRADLTADQCAAAIRARTQEKP